MKYRNSYLANKNMSATVYSLRRQVINLIYEAQSLADLPRISVRVTDNHDSILGVAQMRGNIIWISERAVVSRAVVFHEILHAVFGQTHVNDCPLMAPAIDSNLDRETCDKLFKKYAGAL